MHYKTGNFSLNRISLLNAQTGDVFERVNFAQKSPHTLICEGVTELTFLNCNLTNCDIPADAIAEGCNRAQINRCSHLHPDIGLSECETECEHMINKDEVWVDGVLVDTFYQYKDINLGA